MSDDKRVFLQLSASIDIETGSFSSELTTPPDFTPDMVHDLLCQVLHKVTGQDCDDDEQPEVTLSKVH
jgi:hypothetical protein